jgi:hypothetical protein
MQKGRQAVGSTEAAQRPANMYTNEMGPVMSADERVKFVNQFDMVKFEDRVR